MKLVAVPRGLLILYQINTMNALVLGLIVIFGR
jgi:hypothetical protein